MHLWSDYEGKTIDTFSLGPLIRPEGRTAFFFTRTETGAPDVIRLTESLNDEAEMIERWRQVSELEQEHLVKIKRFGQTSFESTPLAFALMEPSDGSLAEILRERPLTPAETREVAVSLVAALTSLHENGLVHEHVEPANVLAVGDVVKLRSDCVRECRIDSEFLTQQQCEELKQKDIVGLAAILLEALTLEKPVEGGARAGVRLPAPFDRIVKQGLNGTMNLKEMDALLNPPSAKPASIPGAAAAKGGKVIPIASPRAALQMELQGVPAGPVGAGPAPAGPSIADSAPVPTRASNSEWAPLLESSARAAITPLAAGPELRVRRNRLGVEQQDRPLSFWAACGAGVLVLLVVVWLLLRGGSVTQGQSGPVGAPQASASAPPGALRQLPVPVAAPAVPPGNGYASIADRPQLKAARGPVATAATQPGWHVVAFTYNHEEQARAKVASVRQRHPSLSPEVFAPQGHAPFFVGLGGAMSEREAVTVRNQARKDGLPRDVFLRRFGNR